MKPASKLLLWLSFSLYYYVVQGLNITDLVFGGKTDYVPAAFGDFNLDKHTDLIVLSHGGKTVQVLISHLDSPLLRESDLVCTFKSLSIKGVVPGDFDGNGAMDLLLVSLEKETRMYEVYILWGNRKNLTLNCDIEKNEAIVMKGQPLVMDVNGDMIPDIFGEDQTGNRTFWIFGPEGPPQPVRMEGTSLPKLKLPSSHAFIDLDDDLAADLWVSAEGRYEIWSTKNGKYQFVKEVLLSDDVDVVGQVTFADIDLDGKIEAIVPVCKKNSDCKESHLRLYDFERSVWSSVDASFVDENLNVWRFPSPPPPQYMFLDTVTLRAGDFNLDGFPDFLVTLVDSSNKAQVILLENTECKDSTCDYPRKFVSKWDHFKTFGETVLGTFCDFQEDGTLDVLLVQKLDDGKYQVNVYKDAIEYDAVFVKVLIGGCYGEICKQQNVAYGSNQPGPSITYSITTSTGGTQRARTTQLSQSAHNALQLPYTIFGLGRNWNFVEVLDVGIPRGNYSHTLTSSFTQIIPNSQLIVIPYPMENPDRWVSKLFITPSKAMLKTAGALIGTCLFVAGIIAILHRREKQQDKREKQQDSHKFHFDAM